MRIAVACAAALAACSGTAVPPTPTGVSCPDAPAIERRVAALRRDGWLDRALIEVEAAARCDAQELRRARAEVLGELGLVDRAIAAWGQVAGDHRDQLAALRALPPARRDATDAERGRAAALFARGVTMRFAGNPNGAIAELRRSYALAPHPLTIVQIGLAQQAAGRPVEYRKAIARALALAEELAGARAQLRIQRGHLQPVTSLAVTPDGHTLASGSNDPHVILWDLTSGRPLHDLVDGGAVESVAFGPGGDALFVGRTDVLARYDAHTGELAWRTPHRPGRLQSLAVGGRRVATGGEQPVVSVWDADSGAPLASFPHADLVYSVALSPDGTRLAAGARGGEIRVFDLLRGVETARWQSGGNCYALAFSPDGGVLASGNDGWVQLWHPVAGARMGAMEHEGSIYAVAFSPDGGQLISASSAGTAVVWDADTRTPVATLRGHTRWVSAAQFRPGTTQVVTGSWDDTIKVWDQAGGEPLRTLHGRGAAMSSVAFAPGGGALAAGSDDGTVKLWQLGAVTGVRSLPGHRGRVGPVAFTGDGGLLAAGGDDHEIRLWRAADGEPVATLTGHTSRVAALASAAGRLASIGGDDDVILWDPPAAAPRARFPGHRPAGYAVALDAGANRVASGGEDYGASYLRVRDLATGATVDDLRGYDGAVLALAFSPDGRRLAGASKVITLWDPARPDPLLTLEMGSTREYAKALAFDHRGDLLAAGSLGLIAAWDGEGRPRWSITGHESWVEGVAFSPDDRILASASEDRTVKLWDAASGALLATLFSDGDRWLVFTPDGRVDASSADDAA
ncbi:MAG TPA: WD40 repeat domain-containing protein, partial [Kofleriaceae bacterium]|nr:WD40 repeat domain-containing protein [Kofleriaceae bacterium]